VERLEELPAQAVVDGVALLGPIQRDAPNALGHVFDQDLRFAHPGPPLRAFENARI
jgi:hypothetical protein